MTLSELTCDAAVDWRSPHEQSWFSKRHCGKHNEFDYPAYCTSCGRERKMSDEKKEMHSSKCGQYR